MISINQAFTILNQLTFPLNEKEVSLLDARDCVLAQTVYSPINMPPFRQSNMDGYALASNDLLEYEIVGEVKAGDSQQFELKSGQAVKIFTGAAVPDSAFAVIQIEKVTVNGTRLHLQQTVATATNIRAMGSQILKDEIALEKGIKLNAAAIGFLAGLGFTSVNVYQKPRVGIVITGNELVSPGTPLPYGKVYESNGIMLKAAVEKAGFNYISMFYVDDDFENTKAILAKAIDDNELIIVSGGISVGDYDFSGTALHSLGVETLFHKVNQKPGKPLYAGKLNDKIIFGLPGNPAAALTCFYVYVQTTLERISGMKSNYGNMIHKQLAHDYEVSNTREQLLKGTINNDQVTILPHQDSSMLDSFAVADCLVYLKDGNFSKQINDLVEVFIF